MSVDDRVPADVRAGVQREVQIPEDRRQVIVMVPADEHRLRAVSDEPEDLLHLDPFVDQGLRELVLEVAGDDHLFRLRPVEHLAEAFEDHPALESRDRDALLREGPFEPEVEVRDHEGPFVPQEEGEVPRRLHALRNLEAVHRRHGSQENEIRLGTGVPRLLASFGQSQVVDSSDIPLSRVAIAVTLLLAGIAVEVALNVAFHWSARDWQMIVYDRILLPRVTIYLLFPPFRQNCWR